MKLTLITLLQLALASCSQPSNCCGNGKLFVVPQRVISSSAGELCRQNGGQLAQLTVADMPLASNVTFGCSGANSESWIGSYEVRTAVQCLVITTGSAAPGASINVPADCNKMLYPLCQVREGGCQKGCDCPDCCKGGDRPGCCKKGCDCPVCCKGKDCDHKPCKEGCCKDHGCPCGRDGCKRSDVCPLKDQDDYLVRGNPMGVHQDDGKHSQCDACKGPCMPGCKCDQCGGMPTSHDYSNSSECDDEMSGSYDGGMPGGRSDGSDEEDHGGMQDGPDGGMRGGRHRGQDGDNNSMHEGSDSMPGGNDEKAQQGTDGPVDLVAHKSDKTTAQNNKTTAQDKTAAQSNKNAVQHNEAVAKTKTTLQLKKINVKKSV
jgi:hypothetical protein